MATEVFTIRIESDVLSSLRKMAKRENRSLSSFAAEKLREAVSDIQRTDLMIHKINDECLQIETMISIMQAFNKEVYATILGRSEISFSTKEEREEAVARKKRALAGIEEYLNSAGRKIADGENVWGQISE